MHSFSEVTNLFEEFLWKEVELPQEPQLLYEPCRYLLESGGKRIRPALCLMGQELYSDLSGAAFHAATAIELFHNFTLMHDDIMDEAPMRRGRPSVHVKYSLTTGILSGDALSIHAYRQLESLDSAMLSRVFPVFNRTAVDVCEGQQFDFEYESQDVISKEQYLKMIELKTAVLIAASLQIGALIGGATDEQAQALYDFGKYMGIAFQLQDDYLDVFGDSVATGKQAGGDILAGKKTMLYVHYCDILNTDKLASFKTLFNSKDADKVASVTRMWQEAGVDKTIQKLVKQNTDKAFEKLEATHADKEKTKHLSDLFLQLMTRKS